MNTSQLNKVNELLTFGIPRKEKEMRAHLGNVIYIDPQHIVMARTTDMSDPGEEVNYHTFVGPEAGEIKADPLRFVREHNKRSIISRKFLLQILQAMDCDNVIISADEECPVGIVGMMAQELKIEGVIAPRVYETAVEEAVFYD